MGRSLIVGASMGSTTMGRSIVFASMGSTTMGRSIVFASMGSTTMGRSIIVFALNGLYHNGQINDISCLEQWALPQWVECYYFVLPPWADCL